MNSVLAIVGRPNVGKSALFNRIVGRRVSIVHEEAGVTRDRVSAIATRGGKRFEVVDTGGIAFFDDEKTGDALATSARRQAEIAVEMAGAIVMVVDVTAGVTPLDREIARKLRASGKPVFLAVNKCDNTGREKGAAEFAELGFDQQFTIAAVHGIGVTGLVEEATAEFPDATEAGSEERPVRVAIVGRPNVGKSSLINRILDDERAIVSEIAGTTRDSVDVPFQLKDKPYVLIDTAGLRHRRKIGTSVDQFSLMRAERSIRNCDVAVLVLDAHDGVTKQDQKIAGQIFEARRGCVILVNKWDLAQEQERKQARRKTPFREEYLAALRRELFFLEWAPVLFASAKTGERVTELFQQITVIEHEMRRRVETPELNKLLSRAVDSYPPPFVHGKRFKILYAYQKPGTPPTLAMFVNDAHCLTPHYERFLVAKIRAAWGFTGCPVVFELRQRQRKEFAKTSANRRRNEKKRGQGRFSLKHNP